MSIPFEEYASYYDLIYRDKDYAGECDFIEGLINPFLRNREKESIKILDVACGTGNHTNILSARGYQVFGSDLSDRMIQLAGQKAEKADLSVKYYPSGAMQNIDFEEKFDLIICMFAAIDYLTEKNDLMQFLKKARQHLLPDGLLLFDFYNGIEALRHYDPYRVKEYVDGQRSLIRISRTSANLLENILEIEFELLGFNKNQLEYRGKELHKMRYHLPLDMKDYVKEAGMEVIKMCPFMETEQKISASDWNITILAQKKISLVEKRDNY